MTKLGIIGSGAIGAGIARLAVAAGHEVLVANSRGPESLSELVGELGTAAHAGTAAEAATFGDLVVLAVPLAAYDALPVELLARRTVLTLGFDPVDAGSLAESWRFEPESGAYTTVYVADPELFAKDWLADPGAPLAAERLRELLAVSPPGRRGPSLLIR